MIKTLTENSERLVAWVSKEFYDYWAKTNPGLSCKLIAHPIKMERQGALVLQLDSPLIPVINYQLSKLIQGGALSRIRKSYMGLDDRNMDICAGGEDGDLVTTTFSDVRVMFCILGLGVFIALLLGCLEWIASLKRA